MTNSRRTILGAATLVGAFALGGVPTFGRFGGLREGQEPARAAGDAVGRQTAPTRPVNPSAGAISRFADVLKRRRAPRRAAGKDRLQLYMMDLVKGGTTLIVDEPDPGLDYCNAPNWSHDGTRIVFHARSWTGVGASRIKAIEVRDGRPTLTDLGSGSCQIFSPDDKRIAFMLNPGGEPGAEAGVWVMQADGSNRRQVGDYGFPGFPFWSPDGRDFVLNQDTKPTQSLVINRETKARDLAAAASNLLKTAGAFLISQCDSASGAFVRHQARITSVEVAKEILLQEHCDRSKIRQKLYDKLLAADDEQQVWLRRDIDYIEGSIRQIGVAMKSLIYLADSALASQGESTSNAPAT